MEGLLAIMLDLFDQLPQANLIALSTITAGMYVLHGGGGCILLIIVEIFKGFKFHW